MSFAAVAGIAGAAITAGASIYSSRRAQQTGSQSAALADPFAANRPQFAQMLSDNWGRLTSMDPKEIMQDPQFQFLKEQGLGAIGAGAAAGGAFNSGGKALEGGKFATGLASQFLDKRWQQKQQILQMLGQLSGGTTGSPGAAGQLYGYGQSAATNYLNQGVGNTMAMLGRVPWANFSMPGSNQNSGPTDYTNPNSYQGP